MDCAVFRHHERQWHGKRHGNNQLEQTRWGGSGGPVGEQDPTMGRVRCAFEDAGDGRSIKKGSGNNGGVREGKLVNLRG